MKIIWLVLAFIVSHQIIAQEQQEYPIDKELTECLKYDFSTAGMVECIGKAYDKWDKELNKYYKLLMGILDEPSKVKLKNAQLAWIKFRDAEFSLLDNFYAKKEGTMYIPMQADDRLEIVRKRALELQRNYKLVAEE